MKAFHRKALALGALGKFADASAEYAKAVELEPGNAWLIRQHEQMKRQEDEAPITSEAQWARK